MSTPTLGIPAPTTLGTPPQATLPHTSNTSDTGYEFTTVTIYKTALEPTTTPIAHSSEARSESPGDTQGAFLPTASISVGLPAAETTASASVHSASPSTMETATSGSTLADFATGNKSMRMLFLLLSIEHSLCA